MTATSPACTAEPSPIASSWYFTPLSVLANLQDSGLQTLYQKSGALPSTKLTSSRVRTLVGQDLQAPQDQGMTTHQDAACCGCSEDSCMQDTPSMMLWPHLM